MDRKKSTSNIVLPIFYKVDPSDVGYLKGRFGEAFHSRKKYFDEKVIQEELQALNEVSYLHGWESEKIANGHEGELIELVVKTVLSKLRVDFQLDVPKQILGGILFAKKDCLRDVVDYGSTRKPLEYYCKKRALIVSKQFALTNTMASQ
ncbi:hypothetical protein NL676_030486 [Syzygium grande]|nr:hypothetical protein NL676_030486 [Syzygium grande]